MQAPSLRHMIGQMLLAGFPGTEMPDAQAVRLLEEYLVGNFILFARNIGPAGETARLCGTLSETVYKKTGLAPFLAVDQEGGTVLRAHEGSFAFPGKPTSEYLGKISSRLTLFGAFFLMVIAIVPTVVLGAFGLTSAFGPTSLLIMVSVALETAAQLESMMLMRHYKGFLG